MLGSPALLDKLQEVRIVFVLDKYQAGRSSLGLSLHEMITDGVAD